MSGDKDEFDLDLELYKGPMGNEVPPPVNRWKALEDMVLAETNPLVLYLLTPAQDLDQQVKYCDYLLWRYLAYQAKLETFVEQEEAAQEEFVNEYVKHKCCEVDPGTNKFYTNAYATRLANTEKKAVEHAANARITRARLRLVKAYVRSLESKSSKLPGRQGQQNRFMEGSLRDI